MTLTIPVSRPLLVVPVVLLSVESEIIRPARAGGRDFGILGYSNGRGEISIKFKCESDIQFARLLASRLMNHVVYFLTNRNASIELPSSLYLSLSGDKNLHEFNLSLSRRQAKFALDRKSLDASR